MIRFLPPSNFTREAEKTDETLRGTSFKDESLEDSANLPDPDIIAAEIGDQMGSYLNSERVDSLASRSLGLA